MRTTPGEIRLYFEFRDCELRHYRAASSARQRQVIDRAWLHVGRMLSGGTGRPWTNVDVPVDVHGWPDIDARWIEAKFEGASAAVGLPWPGKNLECIIYDAGDFHPELKAKQLVVPPGGAFPADLPAISLYNNRPRSCDACMPAFESPIFVDGFKLQLNWRFGVNFSFQDDVITV